MEMFFKKLNFMTKMARLKETVQPCDTPGVPNTSPPPAKQAKQRNALRITPGISHSSAPCGDGLLTGFSASRTAAWT